MFSDQTKYYQIFYTWKLLSTMSSDYVKIGRWPNEIVTKFVFQSLCLFYQDIYHIVRCSSWFIVESFSLLTVLHKSWIIFHLRRDFRLKYVVFCITYAVTNSILVTFTMTNPLLLNFISYELSAFLLDEFLFHNNWIFFNYISVLNIVFFTWVLEDLACKFIISLIEFSSPHLTLIGAE